MPFPQFNRNDLRIRPLAERKNKVSIERDQVRLDGPRPILDDAAASVVEDVVARLEKARETGRPRMLTFGAHAIKNGLAPVLIRLIESGWITHLATNGAGIIHDWEFAYQGWSSEDVRAYIAEGSFGLWEETGRYLNLALLVGAWEGLGYGESVGRFVEMEGLRIPSVKALREDALAAMETAPDRSAAACDLLSAIQAHDLESGWLAVPHRYKQYGLQAAACRLGVPLTGHPMFGHDIIYCHPLNTGAAIGRTAERDFLTFAEGVSRISCGVYLSVGSAVMSPMVFEKSMSMAQNLALQRGRAISDHFITVVDLQASHWDWTQGEPPETNPDYYLRYCKSFARMGGTMRYLCADNRDFLLALVHRLDGY